jgi:hypothetical protein
MKQLRLIFMLALVSATFALCKKEDPGTGPAGPAGADGQKGDRGATGATGPQGVPGLQGVAGNANVTQYTYGVHDFSGSNATPKVATTEDSMNRSAWFVYLVAPKTGNVYQIPGYGIGASSDYRIYFNFLNNKVNFSISRVSGPGEEYSIRIIRIYANSVTAGGRIAHIFPDIDFNNYQAVCEYYHLPY